MSDDEKSRVLDLILEEYGALKSEQNRRIGFRDNLVYVVVGVLGTVAAISFKEGTSVPLLAVPWLSVILGWTYLQNDQKVSAIGEYIRRKLYARVVEEVPEALDIVFGWEVAHRSDEGRLSRKRWQFFVDIFAFVLPGIVCISSYIQLSSAVHPAMYVLLGLEALALLFLTLQILNHADFREGR